MLRTRAAVLGMARGPLVTLATFLAACATLASDGHSTATGNATVTIDAARATGTLQLQLGTQFTWPGTLDQAVRTRSLFAELDEPLIRILATTNTCCSPGRPAPMIPAGRLPGSWDFSSLDSVVNDVTSAGARSVLNIAYAPEWMWNCPGGTIRDPSFGEFADYMARLVGYYNKGSFVAEDGRTIANPAGAANRITHWELWNEPDQPSSGCPPVGVSPAQYVTMWNATVPKMLAVDPTIKLVGPATANALTRHSPEYVPALMERALRKPDVVSFHGYGGWANSQSDQFLFKSRCCGLDAIVNGLARVRAWAPGIPVWITELNVNSAWTSDPAERPYRAYGAVWGASAFRRLALDGAGALFQYQFAHPANPSLSLVGVVSGQPLLAYWRDYYLARYFPPGSVVLASRSSLAGVETLAVRPPGSSNVHVLVVNGQLRSLSSVGGPGVPAMVQVSVANLSGLTQATVRQLDSATPLASGPPAVQLPVGDSVTVSFAGYGVALLDLLTSSPPVAGYGSD